MKKNQLILAVGGGVSAVLLLGSAALAFVGFSGIGTARKNRDRAFSDLNRLYQADPFPSEENVAAAGQNLENASEWIDQLDDLLTVGTNDWARGLNLRRASPGEFSSLREETIQGLYDAAPVGEDGSKIVPDSFAFGFDLYATGDPAKPQHVTRLLRQLRLTDQLVRMLYAAGPQRVEAVGRVVFETGAGASGEEGGRARRERRRASREGGGGGASSALAVPAPPPFRGPVPSDVERFGFRFVAREKAVLDFVDAVCAATPYACVSGLTLEKTAEDAVFAGEEKEKERERDRDRDDRRGSRGAQETEAPDPRGGPPKPPPRASRMVSGPLREAPVLATVLVDVRFVGLDPAAAESSGEEE